MSNTPNARSFLISLLIFHVFLCGVVLCCCFHPSKIICSREEWMMKPMSIDLSNDSESAFMSRTKTHTCKSGEKKKTKIRTKKKRKEEKKKISLNKTEQITKWSRHSFRVSSENVMNVRTKWSGRMSKWAKQNANEMGRQSIATDKHQLEIYWWDREES